MENLKLFVSVLLSSFFVVTLSSSAQNQSSGQVQNNSIQTSSSSALVASAICIPNHSHLKVKYSVNPQSYSNFTFVSVMQYCTPNTLINGSTSKATPSTAKKARFALKHLTNPSFPLINGRFSPFTFTGATSCSANQIAQGVKFSLSTTGTTSKVQFCEAFSSGGIGDDARMKVTIKETIRNFYPTMSFSNITIKRSNGTVL